MDLEQIKKDLEEFKYLKTQANGGVDYLRTSVLLTIPIEKHLEALIVKLEEKQVLIEDFIADFSLHKHWDRRRIKELEDKLDKAEGVIRFYANKENWVLPVTISGIFKELARQDSWVNLDKSQKAREYLNEDN